MKNLIGIPIMNWNCITGHNYYFQPLREEALNRAQRKRLKKLK